MRSLVFPICDIICCKLRNRRQEVPTGRRQIILAISVQSWPEGYEVRLIGIEPRKSHCESNVLTTCYDT